MIWGGEKRSQKWRVMLMEENWMGNQSHEDPTIKDTLFSSNSFMFNIHHQISALKHLPEWYHFIIYILTKLLPHLTHISFTLSSTCYFSYNYIIWLSNLSLLQTLYTKPTVWIIFVMFPIHSQTKLQQWF